MRNSQLEIQQGWLDNEQRKFSKEVCKLFVYANNLEAVCFAFYYGFDLLPSSSHRKIKMLLKYSFPTPHIIYKNLARTFTNDSTPDNLPKMNQSVFAVAVTLSLLAGIDR